MSDRNKSETDETQMKDAQGGVASQEVVRLFTEHNSTLVRFLRARLGSDQEARDVAQEAYVRLLQIDQTGTVSFLRAYLFRTAANIAIDRRRRAIVRDTAHKDPIFDMQSDDIDPERAALAKERLRLVEAAIADLPQRQRLAFLLHRISDMNIADVAVRLGMKERVVRDHIVKALVRIRQKLDQAVPQSDKKGRAP